MSAALASLAWAPPAIAAPVDGATYTGTASDGASVSFTVSSDGSMVDSYEILGAHGDYQGMSGAITCSLLANNVAGSWPGAPIYGTDFSYSVGSSLFAGIFNSDGSVSGTFVLDQPAIVGWPDCSTGTVGWTATAVPGTGHPGSPGSGGSSGSSGGGGKTGGGNTAGGGSISNSSHAKKRVASRLTFATRTGRTLRGRVRAANSACLAGRVVYLWRGHRRIGRARTTKHGAYSFRLSAALRGERLRVTITARNLQLVSCSAASATHVA